MIFKKIVGWYNSFLCTQTRRYLLFILKCYLPRDWINCLKCLNSWRLSWSMESKHWRHSSSVSPEELHPARPEARVKTVHDLRTKSAGYWRSTSSKNAVKMASIVLLTPEEEEDVIREPRIGFEDQMVGRRLGPSGRDIWTDVHPRTSLTRLVEQVTIRRTLSGSLSTDMRPQESSRSIPTSKILNRLSFASWHPSRCVQWPSAVVVGSLVPATPNNSRRMLSYKWSDSKESGVEPTILTTTKDLFHLES